MEKGKKFPTAWLNWNSSMLHVIVLECCSNVFRSCMNFAAGFVALNGPAILHGLKTYCKFFIDSSMLCLCSRMKHGKNENNIFLKKWAKILYQTFVSMFVCTLTFLNSNWEFVTCCFEAYCSPFTFTLWMVAFVWLSVCVCCWECSFYHYFFSYYSNQIKQFTFNFSCFPDYRYVWIVNGCLLVVLQICLTGCLLWLILGFVPNEV